VVEKRNLRDVSRLLRIHVLNSTKKRDMKVILAHNSLVPIGGAEVFYLETGRVLEENGHQVAYFSPSDEGVDSNISEYLPRAFDHKKSNALSGLMSFKQIVYSTEAKVKFKKLINDFKPDIIHVFAIYIRLTPSILDAAKELNIPVVMSCNDYKHICPNYKLYQGGGICLECKGGKFYNAIKNKCSKDSLKYSLASAMEAYIHDFLDIYKKNVNTFLFASEFMANITEDFWGKENFRWDILRNPFDSKQYALSNAIEDYIIYFGRLVEEKGVDVLIESVRYLPNIKLKIVGTGPDEDKLKSLAQNLANVSFEGQKWDEQLNELLSKARFVVVPSVWHENFPYVILQSFAMGKAVIGANRGGIPELIDDGKFGFIYDPTNLKELSSKIDFLWNNKELCIKMGIRAKRYSDSYFNDEHFYNEIVRVYKNTLS